MYTSRLNSTIRVLYYFTSIINKKLFQSNIINRINYTRFKLDSKLGTGYDGEDDDDDDMDMMTRMTTTTTIR